MKKKKIILVVTLSAVLVALLVALFFMNYTRVDGTFVKRDSIAFRWRSQSLSQPEDLLQLKKLENLDMRSARLTADEYEQLKALLPDVAIQWLVPVDGQFYPEDSQSICVSALTQEDIRALRYLPQLSAVDATACTDYNTLLALQAERPDLAIHYQLNLGGQSLPETATTVSLVAPTTAELAKMLHALPKLEQVTIIGCTDPLGVKALADSYPNCRFTYDIPLGGQTFSSDDTQLTVSADNAQELASLLPCFTALTDVTFTGDTDGKGLHNLADSYADIRFHYSFALLGKTIHTDDEVVILDNIPMTDTESLEAALPYFHNLKQVDMVNCGIANKEMAALNERHPETLFVWTVMIGPEAIRTDIVAFCPLTYWYRMDDNTASNVQYLTELICLDIGHSATEDFSFLYKMPKMEYLILGDTALTDLGFCANMPNLRYIEFFKTKVRDVSPLANCPKLEYINCSYTYPRDVSAICGLKNLKCLWMRGYEFEEQQKQIYAAQPDANINFSHGYIAENGWRKTEGYYSMRDILGLPYMDQDRP